MNEIKYFWKSLDENVIAYFSDFCMRFGLLCLGSTFLTGVEEAIKGNFKTPSVIGFFFAWAVFVVGLGWITLGLISLHFHLKWRSQNVFN